MAPKWDKKKNHFLQKGEINFGRIWDIDGCLRCEKRVRLNDTVYIGKYVADATLNKDARMRCKWFREWATGNPQSLLIMVEHYSEKIKRWRDVGRKRVKWLSDNLYKYVHFHGDKVSCPFCNMPWHSLPGDEGSISLKNNFQTWEQLVTHINEYHGLVRINKLGKRSSRISYTVRYNGDEPYDEIKDEDMPLAIEDLMNAITDKESEGLAVDTSRIRKLKTKIDLKSYL